MKKRKIDKSLLIFSNLFTLMLIFSHHIHYADADVNTLENIYMVDLDLLDLLVFLVLAGVIYAFLMRFTGIKKDIFFVTSKENIPNKFRFLGCFIISLIVILMAYTPYVLSHWPSGVYSDTMNSIWIATHELPFTTHEPVLYTFLWKCMFLVAGLFVNTDIEAGNYGALYLFSIVQVVAMATLLASFIAWNYKRGLKKAYVVIMTLIFALCPIFPYYAISLWKDTVFGMIVFLYSWHLYCVMEKINDISYVSTSNDGTVFCDISVKDIVSYIILSVLVIFGRNNGIFVVILTSLVFVIYNLKNRIIFKKLILTSLSVIVTCLIIQHPVFNALGYNVDTAVESLAIPLQQVGYIISTDGKMSNEDVTVLAQIMPVDGVTEALEAISNLKDANGNPMDLPKDYRNVLLMNWTSSYSPTNADNIKFGYTFNKAYFDEHVDDFMKTYMHLVFKNPWKAVKGYALTTMGFWNIFEENGNAYICPDCIEWTKINQSDLWKDMTGFSFDKIVRPRFYISSAVCIWIMLILISFTRTKEMVSGRWKDISLIPSLAVWLTIMLAVPLAFSFRYVFSVFFCLPIGLLCLLREDL